MKKTYNVVEGPYPFSHAAEMHNVIYLSGQPAMDMATGKLVAESFADQMKQCFANLDTVLEKAGLTKDDVLKCTVFLIDMRDYAEMNGLFAEYFGTSLPARSCFGVNGLPLGAKVEIEMIAHRK